MMRGHGTCKTTENIKPTHCRNCNSAVGIENSNENFTKSEANIDNNPAGSQKKSGLSVGTVVAMGVGAVLLVCIALDLLGFLRGSSAAAGSTPKDLRVVTRMEWLAQPSTGPVDPIEAPVPMVIITHTATENCTNQRACAFNVRFIQTYHIESRSWSDIGYNFLVGGDGAVYEGRGWDKIGAHTKGYNSKSIGLAFIGSFNDVLPPKRQLQAVKQLLELGVAKGKLAKDYKLFGHRQLIPTLSPGDVLFNEISTWPHFSKEL